MGFRLPKDILTEFAGSYVTTLTSQQGWRNRDSWAGNRTRRGVVETVVEGGEWVAGARSTRTIYASVQPVVVKTDIASLPEGRHLSDYVKLYTNERLQVAADGENIQSDIIVHQGYGYELVSAEPNQSQVISHFKYIACKVFKFTSVEDWISGALQRP